MKTINAVGQNCPIPVLMAKKEFEQGEKAFVIMVDNDTACGNLARFAENLGGTAEVVPEGDVFKIVMNFTGAEVSVPKAEEKKGNYAIFCGNNQLGQGDIELGTNLINMFFYTLLQSEDLPSHICFVNAGVKLPAENEQVIGHLKELMDKGVKVLVCGTCLNFYHLTAQAGQVSNMYDILTALQSVPKVVTI